MTGLHHRFLQPQDTDALHKIVSDWDVARQLGAWPWPADRSFTESRCVPYAGKGFVWGIFENDLLLGMMGVTKGALGYCFHPSAWGRGIATAYGRRAIDLAFQDTTLTKITASCWYDNHGSDRVLYKLGFCQLGQQVQHALARDEPTLCYKYLLTRTHWDGLRSRGEWTIAAAQ